MEALLEAAWLYNLPKLAHVSMVWSVCSGLQKAFWEGRSFPAVNNFSFKKHNYVKPWLIQMIPRGPGYWTPSESTCTWCTRVDLEGPAPSLSCLPCLGCPNRVPWAMSPSFCPLAGECLESDEQILNWSYTTWNTGELCARTSTDGPRYQRGWVFQLPLAQTGFPANPDNMKSAFEHSSSSCASVCPAHCCPGAAGEEV